jgi:hypothetical protein
MYLYREEELSDATRREVELHAKSCERCDREMKHLGRGSSMVAALREEEPVLPGGSALADQILRAIRSGAMGGGQMSAGQRRMSQRRLRFACTLAAAAIAGFFFLQTAIDVYRIARLEQRLSGTIAAEAYGPAEARMSSRALKVIAEAGAALSVVGDVRPFGMREQLQLQDGMKVFADVAQQNPPGFTGEVQRLRKKYPGLWLISLKDGLNERDREVLALQGKALVQDIHRLLQSGEHYYED